MNVHAYQELARRTVKPLPIKEHWEHCAMGCSSDMGETVDILKAHNVYRKPLDIEHLMEELGDVCWFISYGCDLLLAPLAGVTVWLSTDFRYQPEKNEEKGSVYWGLMGMKASGDLCELVAQGHFDRSYCFTINDFLAKMYTCVIQIATLNGLEIGDILDYNIDKLRKRYPQGYSDQAAQDRLDKNTGWPK